MENTISGSVKVNLFIQPSDLDFMLQVLKAFKKKKMLDFKVEKTQGSTDSQIGPLFLEGPPLTEEELLDLVQAAEAAPKVSHEEFKSIFDV